MVELRPDDPDGTLYDAFMFAAWSDLIQHMMKVDEFHRMFAEQTGREYFEPGSAAAVAFMADPAAMAIYGGDFTRWATFACWSDDPAEITPTIQAALDSLPRRQ